MESKEYFEKIMQDYNQNDKGRSLRKYCKDEAVDYNWLIEFRKTYPARSNDREKPASAVKTVLHLSTLWLSRASLIK